MSAQTFSTTGPARVEVIDSWHARWPEALSLVDRLGSRACLKVDADGWLSARQVLLVAFGEADPVGFVCFDIMPRLDPKGHAQWQNSRPVLLARLRSLMVDASRSAEADLLRDRLLAAARDHAQALNCQSFEADSRCA